MITPGIYKLDNYYNNLNYVFINTKNVQPTNLFKRGINELIISLKLMNKAYKANYDYLYIGIPSIFNLFLAKKIKGIQLLDVRDLAWEYIKDDSLIKKIIKYTLRSLSKRKLNIFNIITCTNKAEYSYIEKRIYKNNQTSIYLLPNGISKDKFNALSKLNYRNEGELIFSYIGNISNAQNLKILLYTAKEFKNIKFYLAGDGRLLNKMTNLSKNLRLNNLNFLGRIDFEEIICLYEKSDILYAQLSKEFSCAIPSKLYEYLSSGKYIIFGGYGEALNLLKKFNNYSIIQPDSTDELIKKIKELCKSKKYVNISKSNKKKINDYYIREDLIKKFLDYYCIN